MNIEQGQSEGDRRYFFSACKRSGSFTLFEKALDENWSRDKFNTEFARQSPIPQRQAQPIGLSDHEIRNFSFVRLVRALSDPGDREAQREAGFEIECSRAAIQMDRNFVPRGPQAYGRIPFDVLSEGQRDAIVGTATLGGNLVATDLPAASFIDALRKRMVVKQAGATILPGLVGNVAIPKLTTASIAYWVAENAAPTEGVPTVGQVTMTPRTCGAFVDIGRRLMIQSTPGAEQIFRNDIAMQLALAVDAAALHGAGSSEPTGLAGQSGIGSVTIGAQGGALTWAKIVELETSVANSNADQASMAYITNSRVRAALKTTMKVSTGTEGNFIWNDTAPSYEGGLPQGMINGYKALISNQVSNLLTKGTTTGQSAVFFGSWNNLCVGEWGRGLDILVDPYTGSSAGTTRVRGLMDVDVCVRQAAAFAAILDATA